MRETADPTKVAQNEAAQEELRDRVERAPFTRVPPTFPVRKRPGASCLMRRLTLAIDAAGVATIEEALGFIARAVSIDNYTDRWLYVPAVARYVAPKNVGRIFSLGQGTEKAMLTQEAPPSRVIGVVTAGQLCVTTWYEDELAEQGGYLHP